MVKDKATSVRMVIRAKVTSRVSFRVGVREGISKIKKKSLLLIRALRMIPASLSLLVLIGKR